VTDRVNKEKGKMNVSALFNEVTYANIIPFKLVVWSRNNSLL